MQKVFAGAKIPPVGNKGGEQLGKHVLVAQPRSKEPDQACVDSQPDRGNKGIVQNFEIAVRDGAYAEDPKGAEIIIEKRARHEGHHGGRYQRHTQIFFQNKQQRKVKHGAHTADNKIFTGFRN